MTKYYLLFLIVFITAIVTGQGIPLSENAEVSIITVGPGTNLNDSFGHNGFRIRDQSRNIDVIFDYGRFDFNTPNFYLKFAQGKLLYEIGSNNFDPFFNYYKKQNRWIKEQVLNLNYSEKQALFKYLQTNIKPENKKYKYDFFYDNCATKIRDVIIEILGDKLEYKEDHITENYTFRELIQKNVKANSWGSLGMDIAIGAVVDRKARPIEYQFLPQYVFEGANNAVVIRNDAEVSLVKKYNYLFEAKKQEPKSNFFLSPFFVFGCLGLCLIFITYKDFKNNTRSRLPDMLIFLITGIVGLALLLLWVATDHTATVNNYNLLWAFPFSILFVLHIYKKFPRAWLRKYIFFLIMLLSLLAIHWTTGVQVFAVGLLPLLLALGIRYIYVWYFLGKKQF
ncbi:MAG: hypothetical protein ACI9M9_000105 [Flavobacteriaceae bacterium]